MKFRIKDYEDIRQQVETMSVRELIRSVSSPETIPSNLDMPKDFSGIYVEPGAKADVEAFVKHINGGDEPVTLINADTECGAGHVIVGEGYTQFPSMMGLGVIGDPELAYKVGRVTSKESVKAGYRWSLSPCVDILINDESPMASTRCAGEDADTVISIAGAYMHGLQDGGVVATIKHFPGDGATVYDQHLTTTVNPLPLDEWYASYGKVYKELIEQGAMCVMPGHISLPSYDTPDPKVGICPPATLSRGLMTDLLREELGFEGLICSDAICMGGFRGFMNYYEGVATYLKNGGDMILFVQYSDHFYEKMEQLVESGFLPLDLLKQKAYRCLCFVRQVIQDMPIKPDLDVDPDALSREVTQKCLKVIRDRNNILPHKMGGKKVLVLDFSVVYSGENRPKELYEDLLKAGYDADFLYDPGDAYLDDIVESGKYELIICTIANGFSFGTNVVRVHGKQARNFMGGWPKLGVPCVFVCFHHPYFHKHFAAQTDTIINTYGTTYYTNEEIIKTIFGK